MYVSFIHKHIKFKNIYPHQAALETCYGMAILTSSSYEILGSKNNYYNYVYKLH